MQMFESSVGAVPEAEERGLQVFDIAELLDQSITYSKPAKPSGNGGSTPQGGEAEPEPAEAGAGNANTD
jgi:hypothetical protein